MNCGYSREILALYVEHDLPGAASVANVESHLASCVACRLYCDGLRKSQAFIKSRFLPAHARQVSGETLACLRRSVMAQLGPAQRSLGWSIRLERYILCGLRSPRYAAVAFAVVAIVSMSLLGQIRYSAPAPAGAMFGNGNVLFRPAGYRDWMRIGSAAGHRGVPGESTHTVYINPAAYQQFTQSGTYPEGTVMVLEDSASLSVSVKDSGRFEDGWGFYDFAAAEGKMSAEAAPLNQTARCVGCHRDKGAAAVLTQF